MHNALACRWFTLRRNFVATYYCHRYHSHCLKETFSAPLLIGHFEMPRLPSKGILKLHLKDRYWLYYITKVDSDSIWLGCNYDPFFLSRSWFVTTFIFEFLSRKKHHETLAVVSSRAHRHTAHFYLFYFVTFWRNIFLTRWGANVRTIHTDIQNISNNIQNVECTKRAKCWDKKKWQQQQNRKQCGCKCTRRRH